MSGRRQSKTAIAPGEPYPFAFAKADESDFDRLLSLRLLVMRESLERIGRFDETRARERFRKTFHVAHTRLVVAPDATLWGCVSFPAFSDHFTIEHFYIVPEQQGCGLGSAVLRGLIAEADRAGLPIRLGVLRRSDAARFYERNGFGAIGEDEWDIYYQRSPGPSGALSAPARPTS
jgi:ribosomal protein S18 acetylase RimI-like enzyme